MGLRKGNPITKKIISDLQKIIREMSTKRRVKTGDFNLEFDEDSILKLTRQEKYREPNQEIGLPTVDEIETEDDEDEEYPTNGDSFTITFIEFAILNEYFYSTYRKSSPELIINSYGNTDNVGRVSFGSPFNVTSSWWFNANLTNDENEYFFQTKIFIDGRNTVITELHISAKAGVSNKKLSDTFKLIKALAFNNSKFKGKCIEVKLNEGRFNGIDVIDMSKYKTNLILSDTQRKFIKHFISRVGRGGNARYLLNGEPGTGKTESIRDIIQQLIPEVTFIIPKFSNAEDLTIILEACEIFDKGVIIMDDIDLYLGSRDRGNYTNLLGQFLSFFDGVKKRKISLLASTNDKGLVDKAAERPGRFNMTLDYTFLTKEQIEGVCKIHLPEIYCIPEVYEALDGSIGGKKAKITGAFIANLADNIKEMSEDSDNWTLEDTISLIKESYKGFYMSQMDKNTGIGFKVN